MRQSSFPWHFFKTENCFRSSGFEIPWQPFTSKLVYKKFDVEEHINNISCENGKIIISIKKVDSKVKIGIQDAGPGITDENKEKIFDLFYQINRE